MKPHHLLAVATASALLASSGRAAPPPCSSPEHRQFDFWIGDWRVTRPDGTLAGTNHITLEYTKCVIHEHYVTAWGYSGESLNAYDAARARCGTRPGWTPTDCC